MRVFLLPQTVGPLRLLFVALFAVVAMTAPAEGQTKPTPPTPGAMSAEEAGAIADGWSALASGDLARASAAAGQAVSKYPRSPAAIALAVEVGIRAQGWSGGLEAYDQWVANRAVEDFYALRRVARAVLYDSLSTSTNIALRSAVIDALTRDGDADVAAYVRSLGDRGGNDPRTLAAAGDTQAIATLAKGLPNDPRALDSIRALAHSGSPRAVEPLVALLASPRGQVRAAAAQALGELDATASAPQLRALLKDRELLPRMAAAGSLMKMGDPGPSAMFAEWFSSPVGDIRLKAAEYTSFNPDANWIAQTRRLLEDSDPMVRIGGARLLSRFDPAASKWAMQSLANDENLAIREEAQRVLPDTIGGDFAELRRYLRAADVDTRVRAALQIVQLTR